MVFLKEERVHYAYAWLREGIEYNTIRIGYYRCRSNYIHTTQYVVQSQQKIKGHLQRSQKDEHWR